MVLMSYLFVSILGFLAQCTSNLRSKIVPTNIKVLTIRIAVRVEFRKIVHTYIKIPQEVKMHKIF